MPTMGQQKRIDEQKYAELLKEQRYGMVHLHYRAFDIVPPEPKRNYQAIVRRQYQGNCPDDV